MCFVYVIEQGAVLGINGGLLTIHYTDGSSKSIPKNMIDGISIFSHAILTTSCIDFLLSSGVKVGFFSSCGIYRGALSPVNYTNTDRLRKQIALSSDDDYSLLFAQRIVSAKIRNQITVIRRYSYGRDTADECVHQMSRIARSKVAQAKSVNQIIGYEGIASRMYFGWLSENIEPAFRFAKRTRRPASDPFNSMLNLGYSILTKEIYGELESRYLNPYVGFMHKDKYGHPSLASDLIEEWRPVIVDSTVLSLIQGHEIAFDDFIMDESGCRMTHDAMKLFFAKLEKKMETRSQYLKYMNKEVTFREALWHQAERLSRAVDSSNPDKYEPILIR